MKVKLGKIEASRESAINTFPALTNSTFEVLNMAKGSLPKSNSKIKSCSIPDCGCPFFCRTWCKRHYDRWSRYGDPQGKSLRPGLTVKYPAEYRSYTAAKMRCSRANNAAYKDYGGRGIEFRFINFKDFMDCLGPRPSVRHSVDRHPDNNGHYEKGNVRWATRLQQNRNTRVTRILTFQGESLPIGDWAERLGTTGDVLRNRLKRKWCLECALTFPLKAHAGPSRRCFHIVPQVGRKITAKDVQVILARLAKGEDHDCIAKDFAVSRSMISKIHVGKNWKLLTKKLEGSREV
jgi:hypothetical protein